MILRSQQLQSDTLNSDPILKKEPKFNIVDDVLSEEPSIGRDSPAEVLHPGLAALFRKPDTEFLMNKDMLLNLMDVNSKDEREYFELLVKEHQNSSSYANVFDPNLNSQIEELEQAVDPVSQEYIKDLSMFYDDNFHDQTGAKLDKEAWKHLLALAKTFDKFELVDRIKQTAFRQSRAAKIAHKAKEQNSKEVKSTKVNIGPGDPLTMTAIEEFAGLVDDKKVLFQRLHTLLKQRPFMSDTEFAEKLQIDKLKSQYPKAELKLIFELAQFAFNLEEKDMDGADTSFAANGKALIQIFKEANREDLVKKVFEALS